LVAELSGPPGSEAVNLAEARAELESRGYSRFTDARLETWLNTAKTRFEDYPIDWPWLKTSTTGTAPLTIADLRRVRSVADSTSQVPLDMVDAEDITDFYATNLALTGRPTGWYLTSDTVLTTYPLGTVTLAVRYVKFSAELTVPARYHQTWVDLAEVDALRYGVKDRDSANSMEAEVFKRLEEIASVYTMQGQPMNYEGLQTGASVDG
jgi:hypothetical protein